MANMHSRYGKLRAYLTTNKKRNLKYDINQIKWSVFKRNKTWYVKFNFPPRSGKFKAFTLNTESERTARYKAEEVVSCFLDRQGLPPIPTLSKFSKVFLQNLMRGVSYKHFRDRELYCARLEKYFGKSRKLEEINSKGLLDGFLIHTQKTAEKPLSNATMNSWRTFLISYLNQGIRSGYLSSNEAYELVRLTPHKRKNRFSPEQLRALFQACLKVSKSAKDHQVVMKHFYIVFGLLVRTGRRISEILNIETKNIRVYRREGLGLQTKSLLPELKIALEDTKNKTDTEIFVSHELTQYILDLREKRKGKKFLFPFKPRKIEDQLGNTKERIPSDIVKPVWEKVTQMAKVKGGIHDIRRTFTVIASIMQIPRAMLMEISGWKTEHMIEYYSSFDKSEKHDYTMEIANKLPLFGTKSPSD